jgi:hypothetical protein
LLVLPLSLFRVENHVFLSGGVQVAGAAWRVVMRIVAGVGDLVQRTGDGRTNRVLGDWTIGRSGHAVCGMHHARGDEEHKFLGRASKPRSTVCQWFGLKTTGTVFSGLASKPVMMVFLQFGLRIGGDGFSRFDLKIGNYGLVIWASKSP